MAFGAYSVCLQAGIAKVVLPFRHTLKREPNRIYTMLHSDRSWQARWIGAGFAHLPWNAPSRPAPCFRRSFLLNKPFSQAEVFFAAPGWMELYLNGKRVGDAVLEPAPSQFDKIVHYVRYDVSSSLRPGENVLGVILGNGWYDCSTVTDWHYEHAPWQDYPKFLLELRVDQECVLATDENWQCLREDGPIRFNELRNGEFYDARRELPGWNDTGFQEQSWQPAEIVSGPGGILLKQQAPPCRVCEEFPAELYCDTKDGGMTYAIRQNIAGWAKIRVKGEPGATVKLIYAEMVDDRNRRIDRSNDITRCVKSGEFQTDCYTLRGADEEEWHPRFTFHGFQYIRVELTGQVQLLALTGCAVHSDFPKIGHLESSDKTLNCLLSATLWSYLNNFVGISMDCPQREKNCWPGDATICSETGLCFFDAADGYRDWLRSFWSMQWPSGQLPAIALNPGWGYSWGAGTGDYSVILIPWNIYLYRGEISLLKEAYPIMQNLIDYLESIELNGILKHGLGDWFHVDGFRMTDPVLCSTAEYFYALRILGKIARVLGEEDERWECKAGEVRRAFQKKWYRGQGHYAKDEMTALAMALTCEICPEAERASCAKCLQEVVEKNQCRPDFGMMGARAVLRALSDYGYAETAYRLLTQPAYPGFVDMLNHGATTLWESWDGRFSRNHTIFGDIAAWMYQTLAGIRPIEAQPGFKAVRIQPFCPRELNTLKAWRETPSGRVSVSWAKQNDLHEMTVTIPKGLPCTVILPNGKQSEQSAETACYRW